MKLRPPIIAILCLTLAGCQQEMARQPAYRPMQGSDFFGDGRSERPLEPGTVSRGYLREDDLLYRGGESPLAWADRLVRQKPNEVRTFPFTITKADLERGQLQYNIYCAVCHDRVGNGQGRIVQRGYLKPPSYHGEELRNTSEGHIFDVISNGWNGMPEYGSQITPSDRWRIIAYVRALQLSQHVRRDDLTPLEREQLDKKEPPH